MSNVPNSIALSLPLIHQNQFVAEVKERHTPWDQPGKSSSFNGLTRANMGTYSDALALAAATGTTPSTDAVRNYRSKYGVVLNLEQQLTPVLGMFARAGWTQGGMAEYDFTDIDQSLQIGLSLQGSRWGRPDDTVGLAAVANQISRRRQGVSGGERAGRDHRRRATPRGWSRTDHRDLLQLGGFQLRQGHRRLSVR